MNLPNIRFHTDAHPDTVERVVNHGLTDLTVRLINTAGGECVREIAAFQLGGTLLLCRENGEYEKAWVDTIAEIVVL